MITFGALRSACSRSGRASSLFATLLLKGKAMDTEMITAMAAVLGSLVGGSATVATAWITQRTLTKRELIGAEIRARETLYGEFIRECSKLVVDSFTHTMDKPEQLLPLYELLNRIRLCASDAVLAAAEKILRTITEQYFAPNLCAAEIRALVRSGDTADPLRPFGEACRMELKSIRGAM
jgi:hypothetical protein